MYVIICVLVSPYTRLLNAAIFVPIKCFVNKDFAFLQKSVAVKSSSLFHSQMTACTMYILSITLFTIEILVNFFAFFAFSLCFCLLLYPFLTVSLQCITLPLSYSLSTVYYSTPFLQSLYSVLLSTS